MGEWKPLLASGRLVGDYTPVRIYQEVAREMGRDPGAVVISSDDLRYLRDVVAGGARDIVDLVSMLVPIIRGRIDPVIAREAYKRYLGVDVGEDRAVEMISDLVAKWCIEAAEIMGIVRIRGP